MTYLNFSIRALSINGKSFSIVSPKTIVFSNAKICSRSYKIALTERGTCRECEYLPVPKIIMNYAVICHSRWDASDLQKQFRSGDIECLGESPNTSQARFFFGAFHMTQIVNVHPSPIGQLLLRELALLTQLSQTPSEPNADVLTHSRSIRDQACREPVSMSTVRSFGGECRTKIDKCK